MSNPSIGPPSRMSSALPCGTPSITSKRTASPRPLSAQRCASVPPIMPAPMSAIFFLAMSRFSNKKNPPGASAGDSGPLPGPAEKIFERPYQVAPVERGVRREDGERVVDILPAPREQLHRDHVLGTGDGHGHAVDDVPAGAREEQLLRPRAAEDDVDRHARRYVHQRDDPGSRYEVV